jgi:hypothetical protein
MVQMYLKEGDRAAAEQYLGALQVGGAVRLIFGLGIVRRCCGCLTVGALLLLCVSAGKPVEGENMSGMWQGVYGCVLMRMFCLLLLLLLLLLVVGC